MSSAAGYGSHGEPVRRTRNGRGKVTEIWLGGISLKPERVTAREIERRYGPRKRSSKGLTSPGR